MSRASDSTEPVSDPGSLAWFCHSLLIKEPGEKIVPFAQDLEILAPHTEASSTIIDGLIVLWLNVFTWFELLDPKDLELKLIFT